MRIIAGEFRGRKLVGPPGRQTRPITDRVKQSLFDILTPAIAGAIVYDCFAGTGSMGLECLSRGASGAVLFEQDRDAVRCLQENIEALGVQNRSRVISGDLFKWFETCPTETEHAANLVFLDPPYRFVVEQAKSLQGLGERLARQHLSDQGVVVFRHDARDRLELPSLVRYDQREYGGMTLEFLTKSND